MPFLPLLIYLFFSLIFLDRLPGFHFDEAWALNHSMRIAFEEGFWPLRAMTVQTSSWSHYITALFFKVFGASVYCFRLSHVFLNFGAILFIYSGIKKLFHQKIALSFLWVAAFFPALLMNQRFSIEITSFHSLCFGALFWGLSHYIHTKELKHWFVILFAAALGFTSHVYFLGIILAIVIWLIFEKPEVFQDRKCRSLLTALLLLILPFVLAISQEIIWKWKGRALLGLVMLALFWLWVLSAKVPSFVQKFRILFYLLALPFAFNFIVFLDGHWLILHHLGQIEFVWPLGLILIVLGNLFWYFWKNNQHSNSQFRSFFVFFIFSLPTCGLVMITQAPRYYELHFFIFSILLAYILSWAWNWTKLGRRLCVLLAFLGVSIFVLNYLKPGHDQTGISRDFRFGVLKESSYDYIPKSGAAKYLSEQSCWKQLEVSDFRLKSVFEVLGKIERSETKPCLATKICLERGSPGVSFDYEKILYQDNNLWIWRCEVLENSSN